MLDDRVRRIGEDLGGTVAASYYRERKPEKEIAVLGEEIDAGLIMLGGQRQAPLERIFGANLAEKVPRTAVASKVLHWSLESANRAPLTRHHKKDAAARRRTAMPAGCTYLLILDQNVQRPRRPRAQDTGGQQAQPLRGGPEPRVSRGDGPQRRGPRGVGRHL
ncbi:MAG: hypothetical protein AVDCRST_MAG55-2625 [uncultured Rubrobacteraceae bacterium]|uniref:Uncharacterized protein n=1 Tax=uncultured Rubrobacteraceae bacterium TaxID=349277 RepID=A0A6J4Q1E0_9ACTN|nr:MAG: hypothetical protein AVDCRST_MAG55-2625 [uncultured Rubrobacteraceae bacterium]